MNTLFMNDTYIHWLLFSWTLQLHVIMTFDYHSIVTSKSMKQITCTWSQVIFLFKSRCNDLYLPLPLLLGFKSSNRCPQSTLWPAWCNARAWAWAAAAPVDRALLSESCLKIRSLSLRVPVIESPFLSSSWVHIAQRPLACMAWIDVTQIVLMISATYWTRKVGVISCHVFRTS